MSLPKDPEKAALMRQRMSEAAKRRSASPEARQRLSEQAKQQFADPLNRKAASERTKQQWADPEKAALMHERSSEKLKTPEVRAKMSDSAKRKFANPEMKQRLDAKRAEAMRRPEVRAKMSVIKKREMADPARRMHLSQKTLQQFSDPETRRRHAEITRQRWADPLARQAMIDGKHAFFASDASEYSRQRARETLAKTTHTAGYSERLRQAMLAVNSDPEVRQKRSEGSKRRHANPVMKAQHRAAMQSLQQRPGYRENVANGLAASKRYSQTDIEAIVEKLLQALGVEYEAQKHIGRWIIDFYVPGKLLCIECDGDYWHSLPHSMERDARKDSDLTSKGYTVLRLPGSLISSGKMDILEQLFA